MRLPAENCPSCGAKVRRGWARCMRCRASLASLTQPVAPTTQKIGSRTSILTWGAVGLVIAFIAVYVGTRSAAARAATPTTAVSSKAPIEPTLRAGTPSSTQPAAQDLAHAGVSAYRAGDVNGSIEQLTAAVQANPDDAAALNNLGQVLVRAERAGEAIPYFNRAIETSPRVWTYHFNRARAYATMQSWSQAIAGYREAAALFPEDYATQFNLAKALQVDGDLSGAIESYQRAVTLAPAQPDFLLALAAAQEAANRRADAAQSYKRYLELEPATPQADKIKDRITRLTT